MHAIASLTGNRWDLAKVQTRVTNKEEGLIAFLFRGLMNGLSEAATPNIDPAMEARVLKVITDRYVGLLQEAATVMVHDHILSRFSDQEIADMLIYRKKELNNPPKLQVAISEKQHLIPEVIAKKLEPLSGEIFSKMIDVFKDEGITFQPLDTITL